MPHTVFLDQGDHWLVIGDYSGSPRHASLPVEDWKTEFETDATYDDMRKKYPKAIAGITPRGLGRWTKDWSEEPVEGCCK